MTPPNRVAAPSRRQRAVAVWVLGGLTAFQALTAATAEGVAGADSDRGIDGRTASRIDSGIGFTNSSVDSNSNIGGGIGVASGQSQRGVSLSSGKPAVFGDLYVRWGDGWQASLGAARWAAQPGRASGEYTLALSRSRLLDDEDWSLAASLGHYGPWGGAPTRRIDYDELSLSLSWQGRAQVLLAVSPNTTMALANGSLATGRSATVEFSLHQRVIGRLSADAGIGYYDLSPLGRPGYSYASVGLSYGSGPWLASLGYVTNRSLPANVAPALSRSRWGSSLWWSY